MPAQDSPGQFGVLSRQVVIHKRQNQLVIQKLSKGHFQRSINGLHIRKFAGELCSPGLSISHRAASFVLVRARVNSNLKLLISAISKVSRVGKFKLAHSSASLKFPRTSVPKTLSLLSCIYKPSYLLSASIAPAPCVFREAEGPAFTGFAARSWKTPARRFSRRR